MRKRKRVPRSRQRGLRRSAVRGRDSSLSLVRAARPSASGEPPRSAGGWASQRSLPAAPESCLALCSRVVLTHRDCVSRRCSRTTGSVRRPCASAPPCVVRSPRAAPAFGSCLACFSVARASCRSALVARFVGLEASCLAKGRRGKLALMVRQQSVLHQPPNPSIERTSSGRLRLPPAAAHVKR